MLLSPLPQSHLLGLLPLERDVLYGRPRMCRDVENEVANAYLGSWANLFHKNSSYEIVIQI